MDTNDLPGQVPDQIKNAAPDRELPDQAPELPAKDTALAPPKKGGNILKAIKITVARFSRGKTAFLSGVLLALVAIALVTQLTSKKKLMAQEAPEETSKRADEATSKLPEAAAALPENYGDLSKTRQANGPNQGGAAPGVTGNNGAENSDRTAGHPIQQQLLQSAKEQRQKDRESASKAPLSFGGGAGAMRDSPPAAPLALNPPPMDPTGGVGKVLEKLAAGQEPGGQEDQNQQGEKRCFTREDRKDFPYLKTSVLTPISPYEVKAGTILPGVLITGINSDLPGQLLAQARENVYDSVSGRYLLIPIGSRFIGEYDSKISYGQERVLVVWTRIVMPNGNSISLENMPGVDLSGYAGVDGRVNNHYLKLVTGVVLGSMLGAGAQVAVGGQGAPNVPPSFGQLFTAGAAGNLNQAGQRITEKNLNLQPTIEVSPGQKINIFVTKDMILRPYAD